jgi:cell division protein ZapA
VNQSARVVSVEILGQQYPIRSTLDEAYVARLASYVDEKIRSAADITPTTDTVRLVVIAALNIADECFHASSDDTGAGELLRDRLDRLERLIDETLGQGPRL